MFAPLSPEHRKHAMPPERLGMAVNILAPLTNPGAAYQVTGAFDPISWICGPGAGDPRPKGATGHRTHEVSVWASPPCAARGRIETGLITLRMLISANLGGLMVPTPRNG